ncbi:thioesterase family protein [uncultured Alsobacter sp.]|uniref:acyl-CoA thioesterase n=1 Tax=uncultured Alsobacter sp. TaxID=1748258 RepID=UPI0025EFC184|nr:thioesterase family protein [uncultured Alsobacter sp.]
MSSARVARSRRADYRHVLAIPTRWADNDVYAHVNNVVYYSWFDTVVNQWLIQNGLLDIASSPVVSLVVETSCTYFESVAFPEVVDAALAVERLGSSSVTYAIAIFRQGSDEAAAQGRFVHVCVERATQKPVPIPGPMRARLETLLRRSPA